MLLLAQLKPSVRLPTAPSVWGTGQDKMRIVKERLRELLPDARVFLGWSAHELCDTVELHLMSLCVAVIEQMLMISLPVEAQSTWTSRL